MRSWKQWRERESQGGYESWNESCGIVKRLIKREK